LFICSKLLLAGFGHFDHLDLGIKVSSFVLLTDILIAVEAPVVRELAFMASHGFLISSYIALHDVVDVDTASNLT
jgi:hypothetical protein